MAKDRKYGQVETEFGEFEDDEVVFVFRASDAMLPDTLKSYHTLCVGVNSPQAHLDQILLSYQEIMKWQHENPDKVRVATSRNFIKRTQKE